MTDEPITWDSCRMATDFIAGQAKMLGLLDLDKTISFLERADSVGALLDPTGWIRHHKDNNRALRMVKAAKSFVDAIHKIAQEIEEES